MRLSSDHSAAALCAAEGYDVGVVLRLSELRRVRQVDTRSGRAQMTYHLSAALPKRCNWGHAVECLIGSRNMSLCLHRISS
jgi:hypothetical protein